MSRCGHVRPRPCALAVRGGVLALLLMASAGPATAGIVLGRQDWDTNPANGVGNWTTLGSAASVSENTANPADHWLQIDFPSLAGNAPGSAWYETIYTPANDLFAGAWESRDFFRFDFFAADAVPAGLQVRWGTTGGDTWGQSLSVSGQQTNQWQTYEAWLNNWETWRINPFLSEDDYLTDLESIDWVGVYVYRSGTAAEEYGLDDFNLMVPEPAEAAFLASALIAVAATLRRRRPGAGLLAALGLGRYVPGGP